MKKGIIIVVMLIIIGVVIALVMNYNKKDENKKDENKKDKNKNNKIEDSTECITGESISNGKLSVVSNDDNPICPIGLTPDDFSNANNYDDDIVQNCFYAMLKNSSGKEVKVNAYCLMNASFEVLSKVIIDKDAKFKALNEAVNKCGIKICEDAKDDM